MPDTAVSRRRFLAFAAGSPLFAAAGLDTALFARLFAGDARDHSRALELLQAATQGQEPTLIASAGEARDVLDFERVARKKLPAAHWGYLSTGTDDDATIHANREGFRKWDLRVRRLVDVSKIDASVDIFGTRWETPIVIN